MSDRVVLSSFHSSNLASTSILSGQRVFPKQQTTNREGVRSSSTNGRMNCFTANYVSRHWSSSHDRLLLLHIQNNGEKNWSKTGTILKRTSTDCRDRWNTVLRPQLMAIKNKMDMEAAKRGRASIGRATILGKQRIKALVSGNDNTPIEAHMHSGINLTEWVFLLSLIQKKRKLTVKKPTAAETQVPVDKCPVPSNISKCSGVSNEHVDDVSVEDNEAKSVSSCVSSNGNPSEHVKLEPTVDCCENSMFFPVMEEPSARSSRKRHQSLDIHEVDSDSFVNRDVYCAHPQNSSLAQQALGASGFSSTMDSIYSTTQERIRDSMEPSPFSIADMRAPATFLSASEELFNLENFTECPPLESCWSASSSQHFDSLAMGCDPLLTDNSDFSQNKENWDSQFDFMDFPDPFSVLDSSVNADTSYLIMSPQEDAVPLRPPMEDMTLMDTYRLSPTSLPGQYGSLLWPSSPSHVLLEFDNSQPKPHDMFQLMRQNSDDQFHSNSLNFDSDIMSLESPVKVRDIHPHAYSPKNLLPNLSLVPPTALTTKNDTNIPANTCFPGLSARSGRKSVKVVLFQADNNDVIKRSAPLKGARAANAAEKKRVRIYH